MKMSVSLQVIFLLLCFACDQTQNKKRTNRNENTRAQQEYEYLFYEFDIGTEVYTKPIKVHFINEVIDSTYYLKYIYAKQDGNDTITYVLKESKKKEPLYLINGKEKDIPFTYVNFQRYMINGKFYTVYKFARNFIAMDGCTTHFWNPQLGIVLTRSTTWRSFKKLTKPNDQVKNRELEFLIDTIIQDVSFYRGCTEEVEVVSKKDYNEFFKWKIKQLHQQKK